MNQFPPVYAACSVRDLRTNDTILYEDREGIVQDIIGSGENVTLVIKVHYRRIEETTTEHDVVQRRLCL